MAVLSFIVEEVYRGRLDVLFNVCQAGQEGLPHGRHFATLGDYNALLSMCNNYFDTKYTSFCLVILGTL